MLKIILRGIGASKGRLALTMLSIIFGVAFVSGSFILADSLRSVFNKVSADIFAGVDAVVRVDTGEENNPIPPRFSESVAADMATLPEVASIEPGLSTFEQIYTVDDNGEILRPQGPPVLAFSWAGPSDISSFDLIDGAAPAAGQIAIDVDQAEQGGFAVGDIIEVVTPIDGIQPFELSGTVEFGSPGVMFILFDLATIQDVLDQPGMIDGVVASAADGVSSADLVSAMQAVAPAEIQVVSGQTAEQETSAEFGDFITIFGNILLGFALVTLFVSVFIIYNTFAILVSQRTKQIGLLRAIGANASQVRGMVLAESIVIGILASIGGLFAGIGVAALLKWIFSQGGGAFPDGPLEIKPRTIIVVMIVGILVTVVSAIIPALRASKISPLEALHDVGHAQRSMKFRIIAGSVVLVPGLILLGLGLAGTSGTTSGVLSLLGLGSVLTFVGVAMLSALFASRASSLIGLPVQQIKGTTGRLARDNASRNPQRTAATATALMIGLALITGVSVLASSIKSTFQELLDGALTADIFIFDESQGLPFSPVVVDQLAELDEVAVVSGFSEIDVDLNGEPITAAGFDSDVVAQIIPIDITDGSADIGTTGIMVETERATELGLSVGDTVDITFEDNVTLPLIVTGLYETSQVLTGDLFIDRAVSEAHAISPGVDFSGLRFAEGVTPEAGRAAVDSVTAEFPQLSVQDNAEFQQGIEDQVNQVLVIINALLGLCLLIAFFGIINTMALSVLERTREIGLLRAVGMTRSQLRTSVRWEAVIVSVFGSLLGVLMGVLLAWAGISALPEGFITKSTIPFTSLAVYIGLGGILGVVAAYFPARRAAKLNVLEAIAST